MSRRAIALVAFSIAAVVVIAACQDYNLNPVGSCLIQPGSKVHKLDNLSTADILFVVDDSQSMTPKQNALAQNFSTFITILADNQKERASQGLSPFDFYIAVTTSSIFEYRTSYGTPREEYMSDFTVPNPDCDPGVGVEAAPYPAGTFVSYGTNAKVLKFTKDLDWASWDTASVDPRLTDLVKQFAGTCPINGALCSMSCTETCVGGNIEVGSCGSNQEQTLESGKLSIEKVLAGQQPIQSGDFLHPNSKLVVVWVTDEDDCSNPISAPIDFPSRCNLEGTPSGRGDPGTYELSRYTDFFEGLGRPFGAAIIRPSAPGDSDQSCGYNGTKGYRLHTLADTFETGGFQVVEDLVCADFGTTLEAIANLVLPPSTLSLPSLPAASEITMVRIIDTSGNQRKVCTQATSSSEKSTAGWWFTTDNTPLAATPTCDAAGIAVTTNPTRCIYINHASTTNDCEAGSGETYSAEYLGVVPPGGCTSAQHCAEYLTGDPSKENLYDCYRPTGATKSTCLCK